MWKWNARDPFEENGYYHVFNRWHNKEIIFHNEECYKRFHSQVVKYSKEYQSVKIISYCFLPNHFHFILKNAAWGTGTEISEFMKKIQWSYSIWHRCRFPKNGTGTKWPFFEWRFKAKYISTQEYLEKSIAYVNFNPIKHKLVHNIEDYKRTSYHQISKLKNNNYPDLMLWELEY